MGKLMGWLFPKAEDKRCVFELLPGAFEYGEAPGDVPPGWYAVAWPVEWGPIWRPLDQLRECKALAGPYASKEEAERLGIPQVES